MAQDSKKNKITTARIGNNQLQNELENLKERNAQQLAEIKEKLHNLRKENESLKEHLTNLRFEINTEMKTEDFMKFALYKAEERSEIFYEVKNKEVKELTTIGEKTEGIYDEKIVEFNKIIKETKNTLEMLLNDVLRENENLAEKFKTFMEQHSSFKFLPIKDSSIRDNKEFEEDLEEEELKDEVIPVIEENGKEEQQQNNEEQLIKKEQEDVREKGKKDDSKEIEEIFHKAFVAPASIAETDTSKSIKEFNKSTTSGFWDEDIFGEDKANENDSFCREAIDDSLKVLNGINSMEYKNEMENHMKIESCEERNIENTTSEKEVTTPIEKKVSSKESKTQESKALASDINNLRSKYLIGKITGEDLIDSNGEIIIPRNSLITHEIIEIAENQGKLPELIVNMTLPEVLG